MTDATGAILRTADAAGADGVVVQARRSAALDGAAAKASAGAVSHVKVADVVNIARAIDELKQHNVWVVGLAGDASQSYESIDWLVAPRPTALPMSTTRTTMATAIIAAMATSIV